jgi:hypothetical protein
MRKGGSVMELIRNSPPEMGMWVARHARELLARYQVILREVKIAYDSRSLDCTRKEFALWAQSQPYSHLLFALYDQRDIGDMVWKSLRPAYATPFREEQAA